MDSTRVSAAAPPGFHSLCLWLGKRCPRRFAEWRILWCLTRWRSHLLVSLPRDSPRLLWAGPVQMCTANGNASQQIVEGFLRRYQPVLVRAVIDFDSGEARLCSSISPAEDCQLQPGGSARPRCRCWCLAVRGEALCPVKQEKGVLWFWILFPGLLQFAKSGWRIKRTQSHQLLARWGSLCGMPETAAVSLELLESFESQVHESLCSVFTELSVLLLGMCLGWQTGGGSTEHLQKWMGVAFLL